MTLAGWGAPLYTGGAPAADGWILAGFGTFTENPVGGGGVELVTPGPPDLNRAGYSRVSPVSLDRTVGYTLSFDLQLVSEAHTSNDRAGLSLVLIGNDGLGIELAFFTDRIWAQNVAFTHGEEALLDTTVRRVYTIAVSGSGYAVSLGGSPILSGSLRDYAGFPYDSPNFLFVGDDTTQANATSRWFGADLVDTPEPGTLWLTGLAMAGLLRRRLRM